MSEIALSGIDGTSPIGFLAALGALRVVDAAGSARLRFLDDGSFAPVLKTASTLDLAEAVARDAESWQSAKATSLRYAKSEKKGTKTVADLKAPPPAFRAFLVECVKSWCDRSDDDAAAYVAAFGTSVAVDQSKGNTKPTAFHFTAANQQFLGTLELIRQSVTVEWAQESLFHGHAQRPGSNLRWDPEADRSWALMANNPVDEGTSVDAPLEWLAFRGLAFFPTFPFGTRVVTTAVKGGGNHMRLSWPLWQCPASAASVRSLIQLPLVKREVSARRARGIFALCTSEIKRTAQGFGNFGPANVGV